jgi:hypothetical protein
MSFKKYDKVRESFDDLEFKSKNIKYKVIFPTYFIPEVLTIHLKKTKKLVFNNFYF